MKDLACMNLIDHIYYINLDNRPDRNESVLKNTIAPLNVDKDIITRISAVDRTQEKTKSKRAAGCSRSHMNIWKLAIQNNQKFIMIIEDDFIWTRSIDIIKQGIDELFDYDRNFNICCIGYNHRVAKLTKISKLLHEGKNIQTTSCYIINTKFAEKLLPVIEINTRSLEKNDRCINHAIDVAWKPFQYKSDSRWYVLKRCGKQYTNYSDIEQRNVNYNS